MAQVTQGFTYQSTSAITATNLNLLGQPTVTIDDAEVTNAMLASANGIGYETGVGNGSTVTQQTNKSTGVTLNFASGTITMNNAALNAGVSVGFTVTCSKCAAIDVPLIAIKSGASADSYSVQVDAVAAGSFRICLRNYTGGNLSEAVVLNYVLFKGAAS